MQPFPIERYFPMSLLKFLVMYTFQNCFCLLLTKEKKNLVDRPSVLLILATKQCLVTITGNAHDTPIPIY